MKASMSRLLDSLKAGSELYYNVAIVSTIFCRTLCVFHGLGYGLVDSTFHILPNY